MAGITPPDLQKARRGADYPATSDQLFGRSPRTTTRPRRSPRRISHLGKKKFENPAEVSKAVFQNE
ncbi:hypothetical protein SCANM63S_01335 [Streptomyces canarius]